MGATGSNVVLAFVPLRGWCHFEHARAARGKSIFWKNGKMKWRCHTCYRCHLAILSWRHLCHSGVVAFWACQSCQKKVHSLKERNNKMVMPHMPWMPLGSIVIQIYVPSHGWCLFEHARAARAARETWFLKEQNNQMVMPHMPWMPLGSIVLPVYVLSQGWCHFEHARAVRGNPLLWKNRPIKW